MAVSTAGNHSSGCDWERGGWGGYAIHGQLKMCELGAGTLPCLSCLGRNAERWR
jgi:hypothetical protein